MWSRTGRGLWAYLRRSPLTFSWLALLLATTIVQHSVSPQVLDRLLINRSTNIDQLTTDPIDVMFRSLLWLDGGDGPAYWLPYAVAFVVFHAPAERWLGTVRWLAVGLTGHLLATLISEGALAVAINKGIAGEWMRNTQDVGVSYFLAAVVAVLTFHIVRPWRWWYLGGVLVSYGTPLIVDLNFTALGHFSAVLIGLACYPLTRGRLNDQWDPPATAHRLLRQWRDRSPSS